MKTETFPKPRILVSKCLGFEKCRYDGSVINDANIKKLKKHVEFITVCPEKEIGLGVPRNPVRLIIDKGEKYLFQPATGKDVTKEMQVFIADFLNELKNIDGIILKHRSPSCGLHNVKTYNGFNDKANHTRDKGIFGEAILKKFSGYPIEDEGRLRNFLIREHFLIKVFTIASFRQIKDNPTMKDLVNFHSRNKFLFMAHDQNLMKKLGNITANHANHDVQTVYSDYETTMLALLEKKPLFTSWINVVQHAFGFISDNLRPDEKQFFLNAIEEYRDERIPLSVLIKLLHSWAIRFEQEYLINQTFLSPYPLDLSDIKDSGKGRDT